MLRPPEEHEAWLAEARERNARLRRDQVHRYARDHMLPRLDLESGGGIGSSGGGGGGGGGGGSGGGFGRIRLRPLSEGLGSEGGLSPLNRHLVAAAAALGPFAIFLLCVWIWGPGGSVGDAAKPPAGRRERPPANAAVVAAAAAAAAAEDAATATAAAVAAAAADKRLTRLESEVARLAAARAPDRGADGQN